MTDRSDPVALLGQRAREVYRLQHDLDVQRRRADLLEEAVVAAAHGDTEPAERFAMLASMGQPVIAARAVLGGYHLEQMVSTCLVSMQARGLCKLYRIVLKAPAADQILVRVEVGFRIVLENCPGELLTEWGPILLEEVWEEHNVVTIHLKNTGPPQSGVSVTALGDFARQGSPPWAQAFNQW